MNEAAGEASAREPTDAESTGGFGELGPIGDNRPALRNRPALK